MSFDSRRLASNQTDVILFSSFWRRSSFFPVSFLPFLYLCQEPRVFLRVCSPTRIRTLTGIPDGPRAVGRLYLPVQVVIAAAFVRRRRRAAGVARGATVASDALRSEGVAARAHAATGARRIRPPAESCPGKLQLLDNDSSGGGPARGSGSRPGDEKARPSPAPRLSSPCVRLHAAVETLGPAENRSSHK